MLRAPEDAGFVHPLRQRRRPRPPEPRSTSSRRPSDAAGDPARRQPLGHDAPAGRSSIVRRGSRSGRIVLRSTPRARHGRTIDADSFLDDVSRIPTIRDWGLSPGDVAGRLREGMPTGDAIGAIFEAYAEAAGKPRWGDKTPMYMRHLGLLEELFPEAQYVHLVRDGRDAALSFLQMPEGTFTRTWAHPKTPAQFACLWRKEVGGARALGRRAGSAAITRCATRSSSRTSRPPFVGSARLPRFRSSPRCSTTPDPSTSPRSRISNGF